MLGGSVASKTPTQRSLELLRSRGYTVAVVERSSNFRGVFRRHDLWNIGDLLARDQVVPHAALLDLAIQGQTVLVTGAGGSIGSELCRQIINSARNHRAFG